MEKPEHLLGCIQLASNVPGAKPSRIEVMPLGKFNLRGQKFTVTEADLEAFAADINERGDKISIDYDHSFIESGNSLAAGWFLPGTASVEGDRLMADVEWTAAAAQAIKEGKYRFLSPEFSFQKKDQATGKYSPGHQMHAAGITNRPFFDQLAPLTASAKGLAEIFAAAEGDEETDDDTTIASAAGGKESTMKGLAEVYGLKADASEDEILAAAQAYRQKATELETENGTLKAQVAAAPAPIPADTLATLAASAAKGEAAAKKLHENEREALIAAAVREGKILASQKPAYAALFDTNPEETTKMVEALAANAFPLVPIGSEESLVDEDGKKIDVMTATIEGSDYEAYPESAQLDAAAQRILTAAGKLTYTEEEYFVACTRAERELGLNRVNRDTGAVTGRR